MGWLSNVFLDMTPKTKATKDKLINGIPSTLNFCFQGHH
jgi:hypothetical protein